MTSMAFATRIHADRHQRTREVSASQCTELPRLCCLLWPAVQQVCACPARHACLGTGRTVSWPVPLRSSMLCRAALPTSSRLGATVRPLVPGAFQGLAARRPQQQQQKHGRSSSVLVRSDKRKSYMFEVEWTGDQHQLQSGQAEQVCGRTPVGGCGRVGGG
jgi:hypothetical protein